MAYFTQHTLEVRKINNEAQFNQLTDYMRAHELIGYAFDEGHFPATRSNIPNIKPNDAIFYPYDEVKWYGHAEDMVMLSEAFPNMYFELTGDGEDFGDLWKEYYHDGEVECCSGEIVYEHPKKIPWHQLKKF